MITKSPAPARTGPGATTQTERRAVAINLYLHSHLRPWSKDSTVVDAYRFIGQQVQVTFDTGVPWAGRLVSIDDDRRVVVDTDGFDLRLSTVPAVAIEVLS